MTHVNDAASVKSPPVTVHAGDYHGLLVIGDPHLEGRQPGFRKDDYPRVILDKLEWCLNYATEHRLLPLLLGDLFDKPRDNPTWMMGRLIKMLSRVECIGLYGNHDCADPQLCEHDSLALLVTAGCVRLVDESQPWRGVVNGRPVVVGGSSYRRLIPDSFDPQSTTGPLPTTTPPTTERSTTNPPPADLPLADADPFVVWLTHHDISVPGYEEHGHVKPREIDGIDLLINGHIHRRLDEVTVGTTCWMTPGNISRRSRSDAVRDHVPAVMRIEVMPTTWTHHFIEVPHQPFDEVFHDLVIDDEVDTSDSAFVTGLADLQARRTASGAGLTRFLEQNLEQFEPAVADEVMALAKEVLTDEQDDDQDDQK